MELLGNIAWVFDDTNYATVDAFSKAVSEYQNEIMKDKASWNPGEIILHSPAVDIQYMTWIKDAGEIAANETLLEDDDFFEDPDNSSDGLFQAELMARLEADNGTNFTALELLYKIHKQLQSKYLGDHIFFEGLGLEQENGDVPVYFVALGS